MTKTTLQYGTYEHGVPRPCANGIGYRRVDKYLSHRGGEHEYDNLSAAGPDDDSPIYDGLYNANCACCWLNHGHTSAQHQRMTATSPTDER